MILPRFFQKRIYRWFVANVKLVVPVPVPVKLVVKHIKKLQKVGIVTKESHIDIDTIDSLV
jgi:hypothetical protein